MSAATWIIRIHINVFMLLMLLNDVQNKLRHFNISRSFFSNFCVLFCFFFCASFQCLFCCCRYLIEKTTKQAIYTIHANTYCWWYVCCCIMHASRMMRLHLWFIFLSFFFLHLELFTQQMILGEASLAYCCCYCFVYPFMSFTSIYCTIVVLRNETLAWNLNCTFWWIFNGKQ